MEIKKQKLTTFKATKLTNAITGKVIVDVEDKENNSPKEVNVIVEDKKV